MKPKTRKKLALLDLQDGKCYWCSQKIWIDATIDHIVPQSRGGTDDPSNLALACVKCNNVKSNSTPEEFVRHILGIFTGFLQSPGFIKVRQEARNVQVQP